MKENDKNWQQKLGAHYIADESTEVEDLLKSVNQDLLDHKAIQTLATKFLHSMRNHIAALPAFQKVIHAYPLNSKEGLALMTLAEALLRIPDGLTAQEFIADKIHEAGWHVEGSSYEDISKITSNLMRLAGYFLQDVTDKTIARFLKRILQPISGPIIHKVTVAVIKKLNQRFVLGETIKEAIEETKKTSDAQTTYSFDMLGEAALTQEDAEIYFHKYIEAIDSVGKAFGHIGYIHDKPGISIKLSALHPRYEFLQRDRVLTELGSQLKELCQKARNYNIAIAIDAEESYRLNLSLELYTQLLEDKDLQGWEGCGFVVQAYQKRARFVIDYISDLAQRTHQRIPVRLVKGAYWDSEIKWAQQQGLDSYPVFTQKITTDVSYLVCAQKMLEQDLIYSQFATHNPLTVATILHLAKDKKFEFQRLQGMGDELTAALRDHGHQTLVRIYAPVGAHHDLLPYLVRRLLENGANTSFVHQIHNPHLSDEQILQDPLLILKAQKNPTNHLLPLPCSIYGAIRKNSQGYNTHDPLFVRSVDKALKNFSPAQHRTGSAQKKILSPIDASVIGGVEILTRDQLQKTYAKAHKSFESWMDTPVDVRANFLRTFADIMESKIFDYMALIIHEAGKTYDDALAEVREAIDFCRYYAHHAEVLLQHPQSLHGATGEENILSWHSRGVFLCISPWNFPLAIFTGQIVAALVTGNCVLAKPASATPLVASLAVKHLHEAGVPTDVLQLILVDNMDLGDVVVSSPHLGGIVFTGSTETARHLAHQTLRHNGPLIPLIAETGGQNAMIVDSSALPEQVVSDVIRSAFRSAGQRCSALRILYVQEEIADNFLGLLARAMKELIVGDPRKWNTDIGPVISMQAKAELDNHKQYLKSVGKLLFECAEPDNLDGFFVSPALFEIPNLGVLKKEEFGPILHVLRYRAEDLHKIIKEIQSTGYGLTMGLHSRVPRRIKMATHSSKVGNLYINRDMIGAVVGVQPFGGEGLSGTGFKAGGPNYLKRFLLERVVTTNLTAQGGNVTLLTQSHI